MERRDFLRALSGAAGAWALGAQAATAPSDADPVFAAFEAERATHPWTMGYVGLQDDVAPMPLTLHGQLPRGLQGAFIRNGPARHQLGGFRNHHPFDGDGMLQQYTLRDGGITHVGRFVRTDKWIEETRAGHPTRASFGTNPVGAAPVTSPDSLNVANTSVIQHGGELLALWEGGSAMRMEPGTLNTRGLKVWSPEYAGMPFSAHPKVEPDGTLWNFGVSSAQGLLSVYRIRSDGELAQAVTLPVPNIAMVHDFAVTERHLVFLLPPLVFDRERIAAGDTFLDSHVWRPELGLRVMVLPKDRPDAPQWFELPTGFVFHIGNAWEDARSGTIRLDCMRSDSAWSATTGLKELMRGHYAPREFTRPALMQLDLKTGRATQELLPQIAEFPRIDPRRVGRRHTQLYAAERVDAPIDRPGYDAVMRLNVDTGRIDRYRYGVHVMAEEHVFVPKPGGRRDVGWLVGTALDLKQRQMLFSVFDAQRLADGPIAQGTLARVMPLGLHAVFVPG
jgi:all-trans-8'-apo-beta-carotenal 15,15'-oxygenase